MIKAEMLLFLLIRVIILLIYFTNLPDHANTFNFHMKFPKPYRVKFIYDR